MQNKRMRVKMRRERNALLSLRPAPRSPVHLTPRPALRAAGAWRGPGGGLAGRRLPFPACSPASAQAGGGNWWSSRQGGWRSPTRLACVHLLHLLEGTRGSSLAQALRAPPTPPASKQNPGLARNEGKQAMGKEVPLIRRRNGI